MTLRQRLFTQCDCYAAAGSLTVKGVMLHSTGANNPRLSRYVAPNDGLLGEPAQRHWNQPGIDACPHAFIGKLADGSVASYQVLPWTMRSWHCGRSGNDTHISIEICEDALANRNYFDHVYREAVELVAYLCKRFSLDPLESGVVLSHAEGYQLGIASNHADVQHWFTRFDKSMDNFRADVAKVMKGGNFMTVEELRDVVLSTLNNVEETRAAQPPSDWVATVPGDPYSWAIDHGITDGTRPQSYATRQEVAIMLARACEYILSKVPCAKEE